MPTTDFLPPLSPADMQTQELRRASHTRAHLTESERLIGRGAQLEEAARANLEVEDSQQERARLADGLAMQGRFADAARFHPDPKRIANLRETQEALDRDDAEWCECPKLKATAPDGTELEITRRYVERMVFSSRHGKAVGLERCARCGFRNARETRGSLKESINAQAEADKAKRPILSDTAIFKKNK